MNIIGRVSFKGVQGKTILEINDNIIRYSDEKCSLNAQVVNSAGNMNGITFLERHGVTLLGQGNIYSYAGKKVNEKERIHKEIIDRYINNEFGFLTELNGQFAILLIDFSKKKIFLSVDRIGIENVYYVVNGDEVWFSDDLKQLLIESKIVGHLDYSSLLQMIFFSSIIRPRTIVEQIKSVSPGTYVEITDAFIEEKQYWDMSFCQEQGNVNEKEWIEKFEDKFVAAIDRRISKDKCGLLLSGGLDSTAIGNILCRYQDNIPSFSLDYQFADLSEKKYQKIAINAIKSNHYDKDFRLLDYVTTFDYAAKKINGPFCELGTCAYMYLYQFIEKFEKNVFSGLGADEMFGGYITYKTDKLRRSEVSQVDRESNYYLWGDEEFSYEGKSYLKQLSEMEDLLNPEIYEKFREQKLFDQHLFSKEFYKKNYSRFNRRSYIDFKIRLENHKTLQMATIMSRENNHFTLYPFLDYEFLDFVTTMPEKIRMNGVHDKYIMRKWGYNRIPKEVLDRKKITLLDFSYSTIIRELLNYYSQYLELAQPMISKTALDKIVNQIQCSNSIQAMFTDKNFFLTMLSSLIICEDLGLIT